MDPELTLEPHTWMEIEDFSLCENSNSFNNLEEEYDDEECSPHNPAKNNFGFRDGPEEAADALNELLAAHLPLDVDWKVSHMLWRFDFTGLKVEVHNSDGPSVVAQSDVLPRRRLDPLREELRGIIIEALRATCWNTLSFGIMLLQIVEAASCHLLDFRNSQAPRRSQSHQAGWNAASAKGWSTLLDNPYGVDLTTVSDTAIHLLGKPISQILGDLPEELRVLHVEPVFRADLVHKFLARKAKIMADLQKFGHRQLRECVNRADLQSGRVSNSVEGLADHLSKAAVTFHGAPRSVISSIVRHGFIIPGQKIGSTGETLDIRCGASYGIGVYSSPSLEYASMYGRGEGLSSLHPGDIPGFRMIVCATLMGRPLQVSRDETRLTPGLAREDAHSHLSPNRLEYIVFNTAQIIPCYVLHIDFGSEIARKHLDLLRKQPALFRQPARKSRIQSGFEDDSMWPAAKKAKAEAIKTAASKWFAYGYGPTIGTRFVIEDIADVSDDEEDYGEFQAVRGEHGKEIEYGQSSGQTSWFDEYQGARRRG